jgi:quercetin 2,3-dioxygenase
MFLIRRGQERGHFDHGWLNTYHTFSFGDYYDPAQMGFSVLRVINEDRVAPGAGFGMHGHRDMEIVTLVLSGALEHKDSLGNGGVLRPGELQHMSAGSGIRHSEFNPSPNEEVHLYQIWLLPREKGLAPSYGQKTFDKRGRDGRWQIVASADGRDGSLKIAQEATLLLADLNAGAELDYDFGAGRRGWLQVLRGAVGIGGEQLSAGDAVALEGEKRLTCRCEEMAEVLLFDLP